jgi:hypothetical protein
MEWLGFLRVFADFSTSVRLSSQDARSLAIAGQFQENGFCAQLSDPGSMLGARQNKESCASPD